MISKQIGHRMKEVRVAKGLKLFQAADIFGLTAQTLSRYERGEREPEISYIAKFIKHFEINANWLIFGIPPRDLAEREKQIISYTIDEDLEESHNNNPGIIDLNKITEDSLENYCLLINTLLNSNFARESMFRYFHIFIKPFLAEKDEDK
jgi:transcriptional regulator with XRE-family HTH domain